MFLIFNCYYCYSLPFLQQKPCQKRKLLIMRQSAKNRGVRKRTLGSFSDTWGVQFRIILVFYSIIGLTCFVIPTSQFRLWAFVLQRNAWLKEVKRLLYQFLPPIVHGLLVPLHHLQ